MKVTCIECGNKAIIRSRQEKDPKVADLYCICRDPLCGSTFVWTLSYSHQLSPSRSQSKNMMLDMLKSLPKAEQKELFQQASMSLC